MSSEAIITTAQLGKVYHIYRKPIDRLKQMLWRGRRRFYDEYWALKDVTLEVRRGETIGIVGRNGSGKSTLLQIVCGTLNPSTGSLAVNGRIAALLELGAGFNPEFTGRENVFLAASVLGLNEGQIRERFDQIAEFASIGDFIDQPVKIYSSGMYARLAFAVAAHVDADILIIDEILAVGDAAFTQKCMRFIQSFKANGTIFFVSHDTGAVVNLCDRVVWLDSGTVREIGPAKSVCHNYMAAIQAEQEGGKSFKIGGERKALPVEALKDERHELLKESNVKNVVEVFNFDSNAPWYGHRGMSIAQVSLLDESGEELRTLHGGELITLRIVARAEERITWPIIGFYVKDRLGQHLFGDNTFISYREENIVVEAGESVTADFRFLLPFLPQGDFSVTVAVAEGTQENHRQHHWIDDAVFFRVHTTHVAGGLIGVPMLNIGLRKGADNGFEGNHDSNVAANSRE